MLESILWGGVAVFLFMTLGWIASLRLNDVSIVDRLWGINFVILALVYWLHASDDSWRSQVMVALVGVWGLRLSWHIHRRNHGKPEDYRYQQIRQRVGPRFKWVSLVTVFLLQGVLALSISAPLWVVLSGVPQSARLNLFDLVALTLWSIGFYFEAVGDLQLRKFRANPSNRGRLLDSGLWALTRHPNYFGDALIWWSFWVFALQYPGGWTSFFGPLLMTIFLRFVSGVALLEKTLASTKPGYLSYAASVPAFFPVAHLAAVLRFGFVGGWKLLARALYRFEPKWIGEWQKFKWGKVRLVILLNHTSLFEPVLVGIFPWTLAWRLASRGVVPGAEETLARPIVGRCFKVLVPKTLPITRKRDASWEGFLRTLHPNDTIIFLPEGRMKRPNGLDKSGQPMTVRRGIADVLRQVGSGEMIVCVSAGLHHIQSPGSGFPKLFRRIECQVEHLKIEEYLARFTSRPDLASAVVEDLEQRRDDYLRSVGQRPSLN